MARLARIGLVLAGTWVSACSPPSADGGLACEREPSRVASPEGWAIACVVEMDHDGGEKTTQVLLDFPVERCGAGALAASGAGHGLELRWIASDTLEVRHPADLTLSRNASGEVLQCGERKVRVVLTSG